MASILESWLTPKKVLLLIFIIGFLVYGNSIPNGFVWDDEEQIVKNAIIQDLGNIGQIFSGATFSTGGAGLSGYFFRPLITLTFMINFLFWGENAFGFHLFQVIFHILNAFLIYRIILFLFPEAKLQKEASLVLSLLYLVHPAINEGVVYIAAVSEVMFTFLILLAFYFFLKTQDLKPTLKKLILVSSLLFAAALFKEPGVIGAPILISYILIFRVKFWKKWISFLTVTLLLYFFVRLVIVQTPIQHPLYSDISEASLIHRLTTIPAVLFHYLKIAIYPSYLSISQHFVVKNFTTLDFYLPLAITATLVITFMALGIRLKSKLIFFALVWLAISFGPIVNIIPLDMTVAERWFYFPFVGVILLLAGLISAMKNLKIIQTLLLILLVLLIPLSLRTIIRNQNWKDGLTLYTHDAQINKNSFDLENNLGVELFRAGRFNEAKAHFEKSLSIQPKWHFALNNLGAVYQREKNYEKAKEQYLKVLETSDYYLAHENLSSIYLAEKDYQQAKEFTEKSVQKLPNNPLLWFNLAIANYFLGSKEEALKAAANAYQLNPNDQTGYVYSQLSQGRELRLE